MKLTKNRLSVFLLTSVFILAIDVTFVVLNYSSSKAVFQSTLDKNAAHHRHAIELAISMSDSTMLQVTTYISQDQKLNRLFLEGKKAVANEGGGAGGQEAKIARDKLLAAIQPAWQAMQKRFKVRQLHYHLGPGSTSFLRVHKPSKFGDNMDSIRHTIVDTNSEKCSRTGFETGRVYSGLRGVAPVWATDPDTHKEVYVGALETGTSFATVLDILADELDVNISVLLRRSHIENAMWPDAIAKRFGSQAPSSGLVLEASTDASHELNNTEFRDELSLQKARVVKQGESSYALSYFPLRDYRASLNPELGASGTILVWEDVSALVSRADGDLRTNIIFAILGFFLIEIVIYFSIGGITAKLRAIILERTNSLRSANEQKDELLSIIAHDLRNPFTPIKGLAELLMTQAEDFSDDEVSEMATDIVVASDRALDLLEGLLSWSVAQDGDSSAAQANVGLWGIAMKTIDLYRSAAEDKGCTLRLSMDEVHVTANANALDTVIRNLVANAIKFTSKGGVTVSASLSDEGVTVSVQDTGVGMDEATRERILTTSDYYTTPGTSGEKGTGLGLKLCQTLLSQMGSELTIQSTQGEGTSFSFYLQPAKA